MLRDGDEDFVVEVDLAPPAEDALVDDGCRELEIDVLALENAGVVRQRLLRDVLDERAAHVTKPSEQLVRVLDVAAHEEPHDGQRLLVDRDAQSFERVAVGVVSQQLEQPAASLVDGRSDVSRCVVIRKRHADDQ